MTYFFSVMRFVPDAARGEFVNLGAVAGEDDSADWELRLISNLTRAKNLDTSGALSGALAFVDTLEEHVRAVDQLGFEREAMSVELLRRLSTEMRNVVQFTEPTPIVASDAAEALDLVARELLVDPTARTFRFEKKHRAVRSMREAYWAAGIPPEAIAKDATVLTDRYQDRVDFGVHNGIVRQMVRCWSFQLPNQEELAEEIKAWAWLVRDMTENGGVLKAADGQFEVSSNEPADVSVVYVPPLAGADPAAFEEAVAVFDETGVRAVPAESAASVAEAASRLLHPAARRGRGLLDTGGVL